MPGKEVVATKALTMAEEYLADHFPGFPVMPGVLMLEAMTQAAAWLVRVTEDFEHSMVVLKAAKNVKYGRFLKPGQILRVSAVIQEDTQDETRLKAMGEIDGKTTLRAQLTLRKYNLDELDRDGVGTDDLVREQLRGKLRLIWDGGSD